MDHLQFWWIAFLGLNLSFNRATVHEQITPVPTPVSSSSARYQGRDHFYQFQLLTDLINHILILF